MLLETSYDPPIFLNSDWPSCLKLGLELLRVCLLNWNLYWLESFWMFDWATLYFLFSKDSLGLKLFENVRVFSIFLP